jgi:hypothetical protein
MEMTNSVTLDGAVRKCTIRRNDRGGTYAELQFQTFDPKPGVAKTEKFSERYTPQNFLVFVYSNRRDDPKLLELERVCREQQDRFHTYAVSGRLMQRGENQDVYCNVSDLVKTDQMKAVDNRMGEFTGPVVETAYSDGAAKVVFDTGVCKLQADISKKLLPDEWKAVADRTFKKGDVITLSGPFLCQKETNGEKTRRTVTIVPRFMSQLNLSKRLKKGGPSL